MAEQAATEQGLEQKPPETVLKASEWEWETALGNVKLSVDLVRRYFCKTATEPEIMHFMAVAKYHRLNPWLREIYIIKYQDSEPASIVMGKWAHARKAEEHPQYKGDVGGIIVQTQDGKLERREGTFFLEPEKLVGGWAKVYRKDREHPILREVRLQDWLRPGPYWKSSPAHMINKVASSQAKHEAFPSEYADTISEEEAFSAARLVNQEIPEPKSVAEVAAGGNGTESPAGQTGDAPTVQSVGGGSEQTPPPAGDPTPEEQAAIQQREQAEAAQQEPAKASVKVDRGKVWNAVLRKSKADGKAASQVLQALTAKSSMAELDDQQVFELGKKLGAI